MFNPGMFLAPGTCCNTIGSSVNLVNCSATTEAHVAPPDPGPLGTINLYSAWTVVVRVATNKAVATISFLSISAHLL